MGNPKLTQKQKEQLLKRVDNFFRKKKGYTEKEIKKLSKDERVFIYIMERPLRKKATKRRA